MNERLSKRRHRVQIPVVHESNKISESQTEFNEEDELIPEEIVRYKESNF